MPHAPSDHYVLQDNDTLDDGTRQGDGASGPAVATPPRPLHCGRSSTPNIVLSIDVIHATMAARKEDPMTTGQWPPDCARPDCAGPDCAGPDCARRDCGRRPGHGLPPSDTDGESLDASESGMPAFTFGHGLSDRTFRCDRLRATLSNDYLRMATRRGQPATLGPDGRSTLEKGTIGIMMGGSSSNIRCRRP